MVQRPPDLDTACVLALLQEEVLEQDGRKDIRKMESFSSGKSTSRNLLPLPLPPRSDKVVVPQFSEVARSRPSDDKMVALRAFYRAKGLCVRCAEKWSRGHTCPEKVHLHALQEIWDILQINDEDQASVQSEPQEQLFMAVSVAAMAGEDGPRTMRFQGELQGKEILVLVNSGSSHTFVSANLASTLSGVSLLNKEVLVQVADGATIQCSSQLVNAKWSVQGCSFCTNMKVLPLEHYDLIVGMDWLEKFSPMKVHWKQKWMVIPYLGSHSLLQGVAPGLPEGSVIEVSAMLLTDKESVKLNVLEELANLLEEFGEVFETPSGLPPSRECDHTIPLVEGASPVSVRPYRYPPAIKDEIERQIVKMLKEGIIQHSTSPFSSSVLLVKKKDQTW